MNYAHKDASVAGAKSPYARRSVARAMIRFAFLVPILLLFAAPIAASDIYVAQSASGNADGSNCDNPYAISFFNSSANWGSNLGQIGPGTTVHLCGTITTALTVQANGTSASPITILFESGARISMPATPQTGAIALTGRQYIIVDGGTNGIIESTNNGTSKATRTNSVGVEVTGSNLIVRGIRFQNLYAYTCCGSDSGGVGVYGAGTMTNLRIYNNVFTAMFAGVELQLGPASGNNEVDHNSLPNSDVAWGIAVVEGYSNSFSSSSYIHDNDITPGSGATPGSGNSWCTGSTNYNHLDPIHTWSQGSAGGMLKDYIYNNYIHGTFCVVGGTANSTAAIFWEAGVDGGNAPNTATVFNNVILMQGGHPGDGAMFSQARTNGAIYNTAEGPCGE